MPCVSNLISSVYNALILEFIGFNVHSLEIILVELFLFQSWIDTGSILNCFMYDVTNIFSNMYKIHLQTITCCQTSHIEIYPAKIGLASLKLEALHFFLFSYNNRLGMCSRSVYEIILPIKAFLRGII